jgi:AcrR family transcriptional regulator
VPYRPTERTEARKAKTRERVVAGALEQVAEGGYASASVQAVAERAGVAVGSVYRHIPSKSDLFAEVFRRAASHELEVVTKTAAANGGSARDRIAAGAEAFCRRALAGPVLAYAQLAEPVDPAVETERLALRRGYRDVFAGALRAGMASGELRDHDPEITAAALVGALGEALVGPLSPTGDHRRPPSRAQRDALVAALVGFCIESLPATDHALAA